MIHHAQFLGRGDHPNASRESSRRMPKDGLIFDEQWRGSRTSSCS